jgi:hypothetical protein
MRTRAATALRPRLPRSRLPSMNRLLTIPRRATRRVSRAFALFFCAALALSASCGADYAPLIDGPTTPSLIPGTFVLAAVDGKIPPYALPNSNITIYSGDCVTTSEAFTLNLTTTTGTADSVTTKFTGFVLDKNKGSVTFQFAASSNQVTAVINGTGFAIPYNGSTLQFDRKG